jgi:hypothetical protein
MTRSLPIVIVLALVACDGGRVVQVACGPSTCSGCCTPAAQCVAGLELDACGSDGGACQACTAQLTCQSGACVAAPMPPADAGVLPGDGCASPILNLSSTAQYVIPFAGLGRDSPACGAPGPDAVVRLDVPSPGRLVLELTPSDVAQSLSVSLSSSCLETGAERCVSAPAGDALVFVADVSTAGPAWLWLSSSTPSPVGLSWRLEPLASGSSCASPLPISLRQGRGLLALPAALDAGLLPSCAASPAPATTLALDVTGTDRLAFSLANALPGSALELSAASCTGQSLGCLASPSLVDLGLTSAGLLFGSFSSTGPSSLEWSLSSNSPGDSCFEPIDLGPVDTSHAPLVSGSLSGAHDDLSTLCAPPSTPDRVYVFHSSQTQTVRIVVTPTSPTAPPPFLSVGNGACGAAWNRCSSTGTLLMPYQPAGTYFVAVEGTGDYTLQVEHLAQATGDTCQAPFSVVLPPDGGPLIVRGDTTGAIDDEATPCGPDGPDQVWRIATGPFTSYIASVRPLDGGTFTLSVGRYGSCGVPSLDDCLPNDGGPQALSPMVNASALSFLWVNGAEGPYELTMQGSTPASCSAPVAVPLDGGPQHLVLDWSSTQHVQGNSLDACGTTLLQDGFLSLQQPPGVLSHVSVQMLTDGAPSGLLAWYTTTPPYACLTSLTNPFACHAGPLQGLAGTAALAQPGVAIEGVPPLGSTQVVVDVVPIPVGDACENAEPLVADAGLDGGWSLRVDGDLTDAGADVSCACGASVPDHVYALRLPRPLAPVQLQVQPLTAFVPRLQWLTWCQTQGSCSYGAGPVCTVGTAGAPLTVTATTPGSGPITVVVGAASGPPGPYVLTLTPL